MSRSVGEFNLVGHLGEGSFATVFLAKHRDTRREFAMKAISRARMQGKLQENLESEISILKTYRHGNIVELYDIKKTERHIYLVLEYLAGGDLRALIRKEGRLPEHAVRHFMRHLGSGLHFLWSKNLVHRDLKPQNLLLTVQGLDATLKIADFGFARELAQASMAETICGSPLYMAPEILQGRKYDAKSDLWSVGAILFEMLAGKPPFGGANQIQLLANIRRAPLPPAREGYYPMPEGVPRAGRACAELLCRLLVPEPQYRASFRDFFNSDVLRSISPSSDTGGGESPAGSEARRKIIPGGQAPSAATTAPQPAVAAAGSGETGGGDRRGSAERDKGRDVEPSVQGSSATGHSAQGRVAESAGSSRQQRGPAVHTRSDRGGAEGRGATPQGKGATTRQGQGQGQGQGHDRGSWWPLAGWRWGGGGGRGAQETEARGRGVGDDPRFARFTRTFSEPASATQQRNRVKTPPNSLPRHMGAADYLHHRAGTGGGAGGVSKSGWAQQQQQAGIPSRPALTPPSPSLGSVSQRGSRGDGGGAKPIPIRQGSSRQRAIGNSGGGYGYDERDRQRDQPPWLPPGAGGGAGGYWAQHGGHGRGGWRGGGHAEDGGEESGGEIAPLQSYERRRPRPHGPSSAPEVSYMGYAVARARERERESAAYIDNATTGRVAYSAVGDDGRGGGDSGGTRTRRLSYDLGEQVPREAPRGPERDEGSPWISYDEPHYHQSRQARPAFDISGDMSGGRPLSVETSPHLSPRLSPRDPPRPRGYSGSSTPQGTTATTAISEAAARPVRNFQALSASPPESYPLQLAAIIGTQRQRMWGYSSGIYPGGGGGLAYGGSLEGAAGVAGTGAAGAGGVGEVDRAMRMRFEQEAFEHQQAHQQSLQPRQQMKGRSYSGGDGSGGSDDFVMVDGSATSAAASLDNAGGGQPTSAGLAQQNLSMVGVAQGTRGRAGSSAGVAEASDPRSLGPRLVAAGGRWMWGGAGAGGQAAATGGGGGAMGPGDGRHSGAGGGGPPPLSLEGIVRCLQIVELFGRRAVLLAQLGDSCVVPAMHARQKEGIDALMRSVRASSIGGPDRGSPGSESLRGLQSAAEKGPFAPAADGHAPVFSQGETRPPLSADQEDNNWFPSLAFGGGGGGGDSSSQSSDAGDGGSASSTCCDSHRLFGEAVVLYLKSLSMAKEAIVWGNQALESLAHAHPAAAAAAAAAAPPPSPPASPNPQPARSQHTRSSLGSLRAPAAGGGLMPSADGDQRPSSSGSSRAAAAGGTEKSPGPHQAISRRDSGRVSRGGDGSSVPSPTTPGGAPSGGGTGAGVGVNSTTSGSGAGLSPSSIAAAASSSEAQVAAWGGSLLRWLTGQFSTILRRAERCRVELRGEQETGLSNPAQAGAMTEGSAAAGVGTSSPPESDLPERSDGEGKTSSASAGGLGFSTVPGGRGALSVDANVTPSVREAAAGASGGGGGGGGSMMSSSNRHGPASVAVAVSAKDIVVRAALAQARESAASEVLGMWEPARKGYEKAALLLETLLLDALVARPDASASVGRSSAVSPRRGWTGGVGGGGGESGYVTGGSGGVLSEVDQRTLQGYMTKFARRAAEVANIEKQEAKESAAAASSSAAAAPKVLPLPTESVSTPKTAAVEGLVDGDGTVSSSVRSPIRTVVQPGAAEVPRERGDGSGVGLEADVGSSS